MHQFHFRIVSCLTKRASSWPRLPCFSFDSLKMWFSTVVSELAVEFLNSVFFFFLFDAFRMIFCDLVRSKDFVRLQKFSKWCEAKLRGSIGGTIWTIISAVRARKSNKLLKFFEVLSALGAVLVISLTFSALSISLCRVVSPVLSDYSKFLAVILTIAHGCCLTGNGKLIEKNQLSFFSFASTFENCQGAGFSRRFYKIKKLRTFALAFVFFYCIKLRSVQSVLIQIFSRYPFQFG